MATVDHAGGPIHYDVVDEAAPWRRTHENVLFHHGLGSCARAWSEWSAALVERYRIVRFDMRGHGGSPLPDGFRWSLDAMVSDVGAVAGDSNAERFHLVGESIGGTVALAFAAAFPERVLSLTVANGAHLGASIQSVRDWRERIERDGMEGWSRHMMDMRFRPGALDPDAWRWYEAQQASADPDAILGALAVLVGVDLGEALGRIECPVALIHPDASPFISVETMADLGSRLPRSELRVVPNSRHGLPFSHAGECARSLREFLDRSRRRDSG